MKKYNDPHTGETHERTLRLLEEKEKEYDEFRETEIYKRIQNGIPKEDFSSEEQETIQCMKVLEQEIKVLRKDAHFLLEEEE